MFIENCRALVLRRGVHHHVASRIYPLLQATFVDVVGRITTGVLAVKDRDKIRGSLGPILIMHIVGCPSVPNCVDVLIILPPFKKRCPQRVRVCRKGWRQISNIAALHHQASPVFHTSSSLLTSLTCPWRPSVFDAVNLMETQASSKCKLKVHHAYHPKHTEQTPVRHGSK